MEGGGYLLINIQKVVNIVRGDLCPEMISVRSMCAAASGT